MLSKIFEFYDYHARYYLSLTPRFFPCRKTDIRLLAKIIRKDIYYDKQSKCAVDLLYFIEYVGNNTSNEKQTAKIEKNYKDLLDIAVEYGWLEPKGDLKWTGIR